ncbi:MAG TPA: DUF3108 domain-containing protein [Myxococcaceae bacterium]|nr:DUF3108 domain-containing protein [Myxococcaceae bacterium]
MRGIRHWIWIAALGTSAWALTPAASSSAPAAFGPGEQSTYRVQYLGVTAGTAQITVGSEVSQWGAQVTPIVTVAKTVPLLAAYPVNDKFITYWEPASGRTVGHDLYADENRKRRRQRVKIDHAGGSAQVTKQKEGEAPAESTRAVEPGAMDIAAATFALRNAPLAVGQTLSLPVFTGDKSFRMQVMAEGEERLETPLGTRDVVRLRVSTQFEGEFRSKRDLRIYLSKDPSHVPLRVEADFFLGTVVAELVDYKPGRIARP